MSLVQTPHGNDRAKPLGKRQVLCHSNTHILSEQYTHMLSNLQSTIYGTISAGSAQSCKLAGPFLLHTEQKSPEVRAAAAPGFSSLAFLEPMHLMPDTRACAGQAHHLHLYSWFLLHAWTGLRALV